MAASTAQLGIATKWQVCPRCFGTDHGSEHCSACHRKDSHHLQLSRQGQFWLFLFNRSAAPC